MHQEVITSKGKIILDRLDKFPDFYLAGGTGLALQLGHRISVDFDFFWQEDIPKELLSKIRKVFKGCRIEIVVNRLAQLTVEIDGVMISFVKYPFPVFSRLIDYKGIKILSPIGIAAMKAFALGGRATLKDYVDLYFILKEKTVALEEIIALCDKKYGNEFNQRLFLEELVYSKDIEEIEINFLKEKVGKIAIEDFFEKEVKKIKI
jgi:hypothetical protein